MRELSRRGPDALSLPGPDLLGVEAAVAILLRPARRGWEVLLCRRAERPGDPWSGHISLPGGRVEPGDEDAVATARRETIEEVALDPLAGGRLIGSFGPIAGAGAAARRTSLGVAVFAVGSEAAAGVSDEIVESWWVPCDELRTVQTPIPSLGAHRPAFVLVSPEGRAAIVWGLTYHVLGVLESLAAGTRAGAAEGPPERPAS